MRAELFQDNPALKQGFEFALEVLKYCELLEERKRLVPASQLLKSGTSIGADIL
jgi:hypothetical protein